MRSLLAFALIVVLAFALIQPVWVVGQPEKVIFCHVSDDDPPVAITMWDFPEVAAENHMKQHPYDHYGPCLPPLAGDDAAEVDKGETIVIEVAANDSDGNGLVLDSITIESGPSSGSLIVNPDGTVTYTHDGGDSATDQFMYTIKDVTQAESNEAVVTVTIMVLLCHANAEDPANAETLRIPVALAEEHLLSDPYDHLGSCVPPVAEDDAAEVDRSGAVVIDLAANDSDENGLDLGSISISSGPSNGSLLVNPDGTVTYTHDGGGSATDQFSYTIKDVTQAQSNEAFVSLTVMILLCHVDMANPTNAETLRIPVAEAEDHLLNDQYDHLGPCAPPVASDDSAEVDQGTAVTINVAANDSDANGLDLASIIIKSGPSNGSLMVNPDGTVVYTHDGGGSTVDQFSYTIKDVTQAESNEASVMLTIISGCPVINFLDANFEQVTRDLISKPSGGITTCDVQGITSITALNAGISNLEGIQYFSNLAYLRLGSGSISDISPLSGLTKLAYLSIRYNNISDISAVSGLTQLWNLSLEYNNISDINAVSGLTQLKVLSLTSNQISDINPISGLTLMVNLYLGNNNISDISAVRGLSNLIRLWIDGNNITDISALVDSDGLGSGDIINLRNNPLTHPEDIQLLRDKGITVYY